MKLSNNPILPQSLPPELVRLLREISRNVNDDVPSADLAASDGSSLVGFLQSGAGAVATTVEAKLQETPSVGDFDATGDGTTDETAAFTAAAATGKTSYIGKPATAYNFTAALNTTNGGFIPDPMTTWANLTDSGNFDWNTNPGAVTAVGVVNTRQAAIHRLADRVFVGAAATEFAGNSLSADGGNSWISNSANGPSYLAVNSQLVAIARHTPYAIAGIARTSDAINSGTTAIGIGSGVVNDRASGNAWGFIAEIQQETGASSTIGIEIAAKNKTATSSAKTPYTAAGGVFGLWLAGGGDAAFGGASTNPSNAAIVVLANDNTWNRGILFTADSITGTDGTAGSSTNGIAINLARRHLIQWNEPGTDTLGAAITSTVTVSTGRVQQVFSNSLISFVGASTSNIFSMTDTASAVNYVNTTNATTTNPPRLSAGGTDTDIDLYLSAKGTGVLRFGTWTTNADAAVNGYVTIKDSGGTTRKLATIA